MSATEKTGEMKPLTSLRGIAAMMIVVMHLQKEFGPAVRLERWTEFFSKSYLFVDFFFVLSGLIIAFGYGRLFESQLSLSNARYFLVKRFGRIYPLHFFTLMLFVVTETLKYFVKTNAYAPFSVNSLGALVANLFLIQAWGFLDHATWNQPSWSISTEWLAYLLFPFLAPMVARAQSALACVGAIALSLLGLELVMVGNGGATLSVLTGLAVFRCLFSFVLGMALWQLRTLAGSGLRSVLGSDASVLLSLLVAITLLHFAVHDVVVVAVFAWIIFATSLNDGFAGRALSVRPLHYLGLISYSIYLDQGLVVRAWQMAFQVFWHNKIDPIQASLVMIALLAVVVLVSAWTYRWIEEPARHYFSQFAARKRLA